MRRLPARLAFALAARLPPPGRAPPADRPPPRRAPQSIMLCASSSDAAGKVQSAHADRPDTLLPALNQAAQEMARKLPFTPARKDGRPVPSETTLSLTLALEPGRNGSSACSCKRAQNGPSLLAGRQVRMSAETPRASETAALVVVGADLRADGSVDMDTLEDREAWSCACLPAFAEERYVECGRECPSRAAASSSTRSMASRSPRGSACRSSSAAAPSKPQAGESGRRGSRAGAGRRLARARCRVDGCQASSCRRSTSRRAAPRQ